MIHQLFGWFGPGFVGGVVGAASRDLVVWMRRRRADAKRQAFTDDADDYLAWLRDHDGTSR